MAKSENNEVMFGARGKVGNLVVFKNYHGRTVIAKVRKKRDNPVYTQNQEFVKERFKEGVIYAKGAVQDPILSVFYKTYAKGGATAYNMALADFCKPPQIKTVNTDSYQGAIGDKITIRAIDNFRVVEVKVFILNPDGSVLESGPAVQSSNQADWVYTAQAQNVDLQANEIKIKATDTPGNVSELVHLISI